MEVHVTRGHDLMVAMKAMVKCWSFRGGSRVWKWGCARVVGRGLRVQPSRSYSYFSYYYGPIKNDIHKTMCISFAKYP